MNYKIIEIESKTTSTGKAMKKATIVDESGVETSDVAIWSSFPNFANLAVDSMVVGELEIKQNGAYTNKSLKTPATGTTGAYRGGSGAITKAMEKKEASIEKFQDNKEEGIKISATMRDAVLCAIAEYNKDQHNLDTLEELIRKWRKILWFEWDKHSEYPPFLSSK